MYKQGQGIASRTGIAVLGFLIAAYASFSWYGWRVDTGASAAQSGWEVLAGSLLTSSFIGAVVLLLGGTGLGLYLSFRNPRSCEYLIDMDIELRKVVWPTIQPLFNPQTEAWGSTYVVIVCTLILSVFTGLVDYILEFVIANNILTWILT